MSKTYIFKDFYFLVLNQMEVPFWAAPIYDLVIVFCNIRNDYFVFDLTEFEVEIEPEVVNVDSRHVFEKYNKLIARSR